MTATRIEWADRVWNPVIGCTKCSPACENCYAEALHNRRHKAWLAGKEMANCYAAPFDYVQFFPERLAQPLHWYKPSRVFVCSMADLFHEDVQHDWLLKVFAIMALSEKQTFMLLTKRPERAHAFLSAKDLRPQIEQAINQKFGAKAGNEFHCRAYSCGWPLPNVWLGTTIWDQPSADRAVPILLSTPAARRFVSIEPMLGPVELTHVRTASGVTWDTLADHADGDGPCLDWVICGGETGPGARPMHPDWPRSLRDQCQAAGVPFFFKQWGEWEPPTDIGGGYISRPMDGRKVSIKGTIMARVGKARAGRVLDGRTWEEAPNA